MGRPLKINPLTLADYQALVGQEVDYVSPEVAINIEGPMIETYLANFTCAITEEERIIGAFGVIPTARGVGNVWLQASHQLRARPVSLFKLGHRMVQYAHRKFNLHRLEANVWVDFVPGQNYVEELGFTGEGVRKSFGGLGKDFIFYGRIQE